MICRQYQPACDHTQAYPKPTLSTLLQGLYRPAPTRREAGSFAILQAKTGRKSRTRENKLSVFVFNSLKGGNTYDGSVSEYGGFIVLPQSGIGAKGIRNRRLFAHKRKRHLNNNIRIEEIIAAETKRLSELFGKTFLDCEDLIRLTGLGRDNVRLLMRSRRFPVVKVGKRQVVSILSFVTCRIRESSGGDYNAH